jgi:hypothetical protein
MNKQRFLLVTAVVFIVLLVVLFPVNVKQGTQVHASRYCLLSPIVRPIVFPWEKGRSPNGTVSIVDVVVYAMLSCAIGAVAAAMKGGRSHSSQKHHNAE